MILLFMKTILEITMPYYDYACDKCEKNFEYNVPIKDRDKTLHCEECGSILEKKLSLPGIGYDSFALAGKKPDDGFRDRLREIKKHHPKANFNHLI
jgi:putative FmdB family regulatory protein